MNQLSNFVASRAELEAWIRNRPQTQRTRQAAQLGWNPDLWENFVGSTEDPLRFDCSQALRVHLEASEWTRGDEDLIVSLLWHWRAAVYRQYMDEHWH